MDLRSFLKENKDLIFILTLYSLLAVFSLKYFIHIGRAISDEISYINVAHAYAIGEWGDAVNGIWSPLYSWLMTPFLLSGFTPLYAVYLSKIVSLIIGFFTIISVNMLLKIFKMERIVKITLLFSLVPVILYFALVYVTPDLLVACILIFYLSIIFNYNYPNNMFNGFSCGLIGAVAFLSKSYAFPFFIAHFLLFNLIYNFKGLNSTIKRNTLKNMFLGFFVFFIISGLWAGAISEKYGKLTISTAGEYNQALVGPESNNTDPVFYMGLNKPPNKSSTSIWDDPSYIKTVHWSPLESVESFKYQLKLTERNIVDTAISIESFYPITFLILISIILFILKSNAPKAVKNKFNYLLITMFIYISGFLFIFIQLRYLWLIFILLIVNSFYLVDNLYKNSTISLNLRNIFLIFLILSFTAEPVYETVLFSSPDNSFYDFSNYIKDNYGVHGNIASDEWSRTLIISYYLNAKYYGQTKETNNSEDLQRELKYNDIDYYFVWDQTDNLQLSDYKEITKGKINGLKIYARTKKD